MGLYLSIGGLALLVLSAILQLMGSVPETSAPARYIQSFTTVLAVPGYIFGVVGCAGLIVKRLSDKALSNSSAPIDYLNLIWLGAIFATGVLVWMEDPGFSVSRAYLAGLMTFSAHSVPLKGIQIFNLLLFVGFIIYFPFTHMTHMVSKYFMWDKVKWDDEANVGDPAMDAKIKEYLGYPVGWSAPHIKTEGGEKSWAEVATTNPWAKDSK
jgi:nitrate reductase gamma subunit